jgi:CubicO group peptidase (beta-lactamase class C family)
MVGTASAGVDEGWGKVADVFRANFDGNPGEVGAACCVYVDGRPVVDLWDGLADRESNRPWTQDTIAQVASTTKGATAICAHLLAQRGQLDLDARSCGTGRSSAQAARSRSRCAGCCRTKPACPPSTGH